MRSPDTRILAGAALAVALGLSLKGSVVASQIRPENTHFPQPQGTEQPSGSPSASQGSHLVPTNPKDCNFPWNIQKAEPSRAPVGINSGAIIFTSMIIPKPEVTPNTGECWKIVPDTTANPNQNS